MSKKETDSEQRGTPKAGTVPIAMELIIRRWAKRMADDDVSHQQVSAAMFGRARMDKYPSLRREGTLTAHVNPWAKQFRDDIEALKEFDKRDVFVRELQGDLLRTVLSSHVDFFCALGAEPSHHQQRANNKKK